MSEDDKNDLIAAIYLLLHKQGLGRPCGKVMDIAETFVDFVANLKEHDKRSEVLGVVFGNPNKELNQ